MNNINVASSRTSLLRRSKASGCEGWMNIIRIACFAGLLWGGALVSRADTHYVTTNGACSSPYTNGWASAATNIQWAVDASIANDTVLVSNGTYNLTNQISIAKKITFRSVNGRDYTTLQMDLTWGSNRCVYLTGAGAKIDGFTVANGRTNGPGGGVGMDDAIGRSDPIIIQNCTVSGNRALGSAGYGGGIYVFAGRVYNCIVSNNSSAKPGGGVHLYGYNQFSTAGAWITNCIVSSNSTSDTADGGGGIYMTDCARIMDCVISNNYSGGYGCGLNLYSAGCYASNCIITDNLGPGSGLLVAGNATAEYCVVKNNTLGSAGEGYSGCDLGGILRNSVISGNNKTRLSTPVGLTINDPKALAQNCVISNNYGYTYGTGVRLRTGGTLRNCLITANTNDGVNSRAIYRFQGSFCTVDCCTIAFNLNGMYLAAGNTTVVINAIVYSNTGYNVSDAGTTWFTNCNVGATVSGANNINTNPSWVDPANYNFRLKPDSPCINAGLYQNWMTNAVDLDGRQRIRYGTVDMGVYERINEGSIYTVH